MSDSEDKARSLRIKRAIAREIATGVDDPVVAEIRKVRREIFRKCNYDMKKYARYISERAQAIDREWGLNLKWQTKPLQQSAAPAEPAKMMAQKGGKG